MNISVNRGKNRLFNKWYRGQLEIHTQKNDWNPTSQHIQKLLKMGHRPKYKSQTKTLSRIIGANFHELGLSAAHE